MDFMYFVVENILPTYHQTKYTIIETNPEKNAATPTTSLPKVRIVPRSIILMGTSKNIPLWWDDRRSSSQ